MSISMHTVVLVTPTSTFTPTTTPIRAEAMLRPPTTETIGKRAKRRAVAAAVDKAGKSTDPSEWASGEFAELLLAGRWDTGLFAEKLLGIKLHPGQDRIWLAILKRDESGWRCRYQTIACSAGNRAGKTLGIAIPILHSCIYKLGLEPPNPLNERAVRRWTELAYEWYHFAIAQETAELVYIELTRILSGTHEAQKDGCPLTKAVGQPIADWSRKYRGEYLWIQLHPLFGGANIHFRTTGEKAIGSLGKDMHGVSYDECGFDPHFDFIVDEVLHARRATTGGQLILIGTPTEGLTAFADKWYEGDPDAPDRLPGSYSLRMRTEENVGYGMTRVQYDNMKAGMPEALWPQNLDGEFIEGSKAFFSAASVNDAFVPDLPELVAAQRAHRYVQGVDPALTFDSTWSIVLDSTIGGFGLGVAAARQRGRTTGLTIAALATNAHNAYNSVTAASQCTTGIDATGFGGKMFRDLLSISPLVATEFGGTSGRKLKLLNDLKLFLEAGRLKFPRSGLWLILRRQLLGYRLDDKKLDTDAVMALAVAVSLLQRTPGESAPVVPFDFFHPSTGRVPSAAVPLGGPRTASFASLADMKSRLE